MSDETQYTHEDPNEPTETEPDPGEEQSTARVVTPRDDQGEADAEPVEPKEDEQP